MCVTGGGWRGKLSEEYKDKDGQIVGLRTGRACDSWTRRARMERPEGREVRIREWQVMTWRACRNEGRWSIRGRKRRQWILQDLEA